MPISTLPQREPFGSYYSTVSVDLLILHDADTGNPVIHAISDWLLSLSLVFPRSVQALACIGQYFILMA